MDLKTEAIAASAFGRGCQHDGQGSNESICAAKAVQKTGWDPDSPPLAPQGYTAFSLHTSVLLGHRKRILKKPQKTHMHLKEPEVTQKGLKPQPPLGAYKLFKDQCQVLSVFVSQAASTKPYIEEYLCRGPLNDEWTDLITSSMSTALQKTGKIGLNSQRK